MPINKLLFISGYISLLFKSSLSQTFNLQAILMQSDNIKYIMN